MNTEFEFKEISHYILQDSLPAAPFNNAVAQGSHGSIFGPDEFGVLYEELGAKMEAFLNNVMTIPALQVCRITFPYT